MKLSLVVPCYNEADNVALFQQAVISAFDGCGYDYEIVFIDDGSRDATLHNLKKLYAAPTGKSWASGRPSSTALPTRAFPSPCPPPSP